MKALRLFIGSVLVLGALYVLVGEQLGGTSANAVVNARLTTVRAQIAGDLRLETRELGSFVNDGETLGSISDPFVDDVRLNDLLLDRSIAVAESARLANEADGAAEAVAVLRERSRLYTRERISQLEAEVTAARSRASAVAARLEEAEAAFARTTQLRERGFETEAVLDRNRAAQRVASRELEAANDEVEVLEIELSAARNGTFLGDGYNDAPYSEQRISELRLLITERGAMRGEQDARIAALDARIDAERRRVNRLGSAPVESNVRGRIWQVLAADGERVQRGQELIRLVNCDATLVTLSVSESVYNRLRIGDRAQFRMTGESGVFEAAVIRLAGSGAETIYGNLAVAPSEKHLERYDVALSVPGLAEDSVLGCAIGRTGRAFFDARPLDWLRDAF